MRHEICLLIVFLVRKKRNLDQYLQTVLLIFQINCSTSNLGGVPVFNLPILKLYFSNCSLNPVEGFSLYLPAGVFSSPICIKPFKKVPVVRIILDALISLPDWVEKPIISLFLKLNFITGSEKLL